LALRCVHGTAPAYLAEVADSLQLTSDAPARRRLRFTDTLTLRVPSTQQTFHSRRLNVSDQRLESGTVRHHIEANSSHVVVKFIKY